MVKEKELNTIDQALMLSWVIIFGNNRKCASSLASGFEG
jgi:hypothetical protein